jgi:hypothetical protein
MWGNRPKVLIRQRHRHAGVAPADAAALLGHRVTTHLTFYVKPSEHGVSSAATALGSVLSEAR